VPPAAKRLEYVDLPAWANRLLEGRGGFGADVDAHVLADAVLLVHDAAADSRKAPIQIRQHPCDGDARGLDLAVPAWVGVKGRSPRNAQEPSEAARTV
jgi:hypothetical protein